MSTDERLQQIMGYRVDPDSEIKPIPIDSPCELGYWCPICKVPPVAPDGEFDERLTWSEYRGFLWCYECELDIPSALCVRLDVEKDPERSWVNAGIADAIKVFLDTVEQATQRAEVERIKASPYMQLEPRPMTPAEQAALDLMNGDVL